MGAQQHQQDGSNKKSFEFGDSGSNWRMIKLKRVYDIAERDGRKVDEVALERYGVSILPESFFFFFLYNL